MAKPYSMDLREWAMARLAAGESSSRAAAALNIAVSSGIKWAARARRLGSVAPGRMGGHRPFAISGEHRLFVLLRIKETPHGTAGAVCGLDGALFFLPSYSPGLNPIEQAFAKIKHAMRKAMGRSVEAVETAVAQTRDTTTAQECANYLANAGYRSS